MTTVVFGARGNVGHHVAAGLAEREMRVRAISRSSTAPLNVEAAELVVADLQRPDTLSAALIGAENVFLYAEPSHIADFVGAAEAAGIAHVVLLSSATVLAADSDRSPVAQRHRTVEAALQRSALRWTFIRPGSFATNTVARWSSSIRHAGVVELPYPEAHSAPVHEQDIAALAVSALSEPGHASQAYTVFGPKSLTIRCQVEQIGLAIDREIEVKTVSHDQAIRGLTQTTAPFIASAIVEQWAEGDGIPANTSIIVPRITGRPARTFAQWATDHAREFR